MNESRRNKEKFKEGVAEGKDGNKEEGRDEDREEDGNEESGGGGGGEEGRMRKRMRIEKRKMRNKEEDVNNQAENRECQGKSMWAGNKGSNIQKAEMRIMLEIFDAARHARPFARVAHPFIVRTKTSDMRSGSMQCRKECNSERVGCAEDMESGSSLIVFLLLTWESTEEKTDIQYVEENEPVSRSIEGLEEGFVVYIYSCLDRYLERERESE
ncbi:hypothetical protein B9Z19DRAFT_1134045 [Tuber borchii]|uniref:Uncharacterized protein n=1 Tax=Tuber borchii TaxID=42251 RepID=A0A2T6ZEU3_TUBBO|nr:hypothetical protein B9Z19DRAFT_1134045 [Tuber borchii]